MPGDDTGEFVSDKSYREGAAEGLSVSSLDSDPALQFFDRLRSVIITSLDRALPGSDTAPAIFVRSEAARREAGRLGSASHIIDVDQKIATQWAGKIHLVAPNATSGWSLPLSGTVEDEFDKLEKAGLGDLPVCIVYPVDRLVSCFQNGCNDDKNTIRFKLPVSSRILTMEALIEVIEEHRRGSLLSPNVCPPDLWTHAKGHQPGTEAEKRIQWGVAVALRNSFRPITADLEQNAPTGRIDICMTNPRPNGGPVHPAVVELKALCSKTSTGIAMSRRRNLIWMAGGYRQAKAYRNDKQAALGLLACFDMRSEKDNLLNENVLKLAEAKYFDVNMAVRVFRIHGRVEDAQEEVAAAS